MLGLTVGFGPGLGILSHGGDVLWTTDPKMDKGRPFQSSREDDLF